MRSDKARSSAAVVAVLAALIGAPAPIAGTASAAAGGAPQKRALKQIRVLKRQTAALIRRVSALEALLATTGERQAPIPEQPASLPPSGPAGGDLSGSYPDPELRAGSVLSEHIADGTIQSLDIEEGGIFGGQIANGSLGSLDIGDGSILQADLGPGSVGGSQLGGVTVTTNSQTIPPNGAGGISASCPPNSQLTGGGAEWESSAIGAFITKSVPDRNNPARWEAFGQNGTGNSRTLVAKALCLNE